MRAKDAESGRTGADIRPRFMVWENVFGAFGTNKGADFATVLKETIGVVEENAPIFCRLQRDGQSPDATWETDGALRGEFLMHSFGECPRDVVESRLSQILEEQVPQKYCLSATAAQGIIRRADNRGKKLPEILRAALEYIVCKETESAGQTAQGAKAADGERERELHAEYCRHTGSCI